MGFFEREIRPDGRCILRVAGKKVFSVHSTPVRRFARKDRPVLVVRLMAEDVGIFCHFAFNLGWMRWAEVRGYRTYIDMRRSKNLFTRGQAELSFNPWDRFFRQTCAPADLLGAKRVLTTVGYLPPPEYPGTSPALCDQGNPEFLEWRRFTHGHIAFSDEMTAVIDARQAALFGEGDRILGCFVRGTDYLRMKPKNHLVQPEPRQVAADAKRICEERDLQKVFLASEDRDVYDLFRREFGDRLIVNQTELPEYRSDFLVRSGALGDLSRTMLITSQYLTSVALLSRCTCLLGGCASGFVGAALLSKGFELMRTYDLGCYG